MASVEMISFFFLRFGMFKDEAVFFFRSLLINNFFLCLN